MKIEDLFMRAAEWVRQQFGRRIKRGTVLEAVGKYRHQRKIPNWLTDFITHKREAMA